MGGNALEARLCVCEQTWCVRNMRRCVWDGMRPWAREVTWDEGSGDDNVTLGALPQEHLVRGLVPLRRHFFGVAPSSLARLLEVHLCRVMGHMNWESQMAWAEMGGGCMWTCDPSPTPNEMHPTRTRINRS